MGPFSCCFRRTKSKDRPQPWRETPRWPLSAKRHRPRVSLRSGLTNLRLSSKEELSQSREKRASSKWPSKAAVPGASDEKHDSNDYPVKQDDQSASINCSQAPQTQTIEDQFERIEPSDSAAQSQSQTYLCPPPEGDLSCSDFVYDVDLVNPVGRQRVRRRLILDFITEPNVMAVQVQRVLDLPLEEYRESPIRARGHENVMPLGWVVADWKICGSTSCFRTRFLVINNHEYDTLLGWESIREHQLYKVDPLIATRIASHLPA